MCRSPSDHEGNLTLSCVRQPQFVVAPAKGVGRDRNTRARWPVGHDAFNQRERAHCKGEAGEHVGDQDSPPVQRHPRADSTDIRHCASSGGHGLRSQPIGAEANSHYHLRPGARHQGSLTPVAHVPPGCHQKREYAVRNETLQPAVARAAASGTSSATGWKAFCRDHAGESHCFLWSLLTPASR